MNADQTQAAPPGELLSVATLRAYLDMRGVMPLGAGAEVSQLDGGVSNVVLAVDDGARRIVVKQALIGGAIGYVVGIAAVFAMAWLGRDSSAAPEAPLSLALGVGVVMELMCVLASMISLSKLTRINPAEVFR